MPDSARMPCPYCGSHAWSSQLGSGDLKPPGVYVLTHDEFGNPSLNGAIELVAYSCGGCGYVRFHDPAFIPKL